MIVFRVAWRAFEQKWAGELKWTDEDCRNYTKLLKNSLSKISASLAPKENK